MKKKQIIFIIVAVIAALIIIKVALNYPPASTKDVSGTISKVDKYRKTQMTEKDVILRSEFVSDTTALAKSIQGLIYYNAFAKNYAKDLKVYSDYLKQKEPGLKYIKELEDYIGFINNNSSCVENTIGLLSDFYSGDTTNYSVDIEKKLKDFDSFVYQMIKKDSVIACLIPELENKITKDQKLKDNKDEELKKLKNIHDQMILKDIQMGLIVCNKEQLNLILDKTLYNIQNVGLIIEGQPKIEGYVLQNSSLNAIKSTDKLGIFNKDLLNNIRSAEKLGNLRLHGDHFALIFNTEKLNIILNQYSSTAALNVIMSKESNLGVIRANQQIGVIYFNSIKNVGYAIFGNVMGNSQTFQSYLNSTLSNTINNKLQHIELDSKTLNAL